MNYLTPPKPRGYWTKERCHKEALNFNSKGEFQKHSASCYQISYRKGWLSEICSHMEQNGCLKKRYIYAFEFEKMKCVYVGLTWNIEDRTKRHLRMDTTVNKFIKEHNLTENDYIVKELGYYLAEQASTKEGDFEKSYIEKGWNVLNIAKTGNLGNNKIKWTKSKLQKEALKYNTRGDFKKGSYNAYCAATRRGLISEICTHMTFVRKQNQK